MNEKRVISTATLLTSLIGYFYAKETKVDVVPFVMISGFIGALLGETAYRIFWGKDDQDKDPPSPSF